MRYNTHFRIFPTFDGEAHLGMAFVILLINYITHFTDEIK